MPNAFQKRPHRMPQHMQQSVFFLVDLAAGISVSRVAIPSSSIGLCRATGPRPSSSFGTRRYSSKCSLSFKPAITAPTIPKNLRPCEGGLFRRPTIVDTRNDEGKSLWTRKDRLRLDRPTAGRFCETAEGNTRPERLIPSPDCQGRICCSSRAPGTTGRGFDKSPSCMLPVGPGRRRAAPFPR